MPPADRELGPTMTHNDRWPTLRSDSEIECSMRVGSHAVFGRGYHGLPFKVLLPCGGLYTDAYMHCCRWALTLGEIKLQAGTQGD